MKKLSDFVRSDKGLMIILLVILFLASWVYNSYTQPKDIEYSYNGIKYQAGNLEIAEPINVEVKGVYKKDYFGGTDMFTGDIIIDGELYYGVYRDGNISNKYSFSKYYIGSIENKQFKRIIYISDMFRELTIETIEADENGGGFFSYTNSWLISAPSNTRGGAIAISNNLIQKLHKNINKERLDIRISF